MCVFYNKEVCDFKAYNKFMDILDDNKKISSRYIMKMLKVKF